MLEMMLLEWKEKEEEKDRKKISQFGVALEKTDFQIQEKEAKKSHLRWEERRRKQEERKRE